ncbi:glycosyl hydrolase family 18 protein [Kitasatospora brasiliensis]|uniref:glycosyl hydrolase family 18 protein n=1 Tax=Kitasatospora brasiliensis TaxID=3058040 RepID=UPI00292CFB45|nr:glycosyl hydrolase family 18 protein [Kitasatospora sp. K002]
MNTTRAQRPRPAPIATRLLPALLVLTLLAELLAVVAAKPAKAEVRDFRPATWNMQAAGARWRDVIPRLLETGDNVLALQEHPDTDPGVGGRDDPNQRPDDFTPLGHNSLELGREILPGAPQGADDIADQILTRFRWVNPRNHQTYYVAHTVNDMQNRALAFVTAEEPAAYLLLQPAGSERPVLGVRLGQTWFFNIHANNEQGGGNDTGRILQAVATAPAVQGRSWAVMGDFNTPPDTTMQQARAAMGGAAGNLHVVRTNEATHVQGRELDYMVTNDEAMVLAVRQEVTGWRTDNGGRDHDAVFFAPMAAGGQRGPFHSLQHRGDGRLVVPVYENETYSRFRENPDDGMAMSGMFVELSLFRESDGLLYTGLMDLHSKLCLSATVPDETGPSDRPELVQTRCAQGKPPKEQLWRFDANGTPWNATDRAVFSDHNNPVLHLGPEGTEPPADQWRHCAWKLYNRAPDVVVFNEVSCNVDGPSRETLIALESSSGIDAAVSLDSRGSGLASVELQKGNLTATLTFGPGRHQEAEVGATSPVSGQIPTRTSDALTTLPSSGGTVLGFTLPSSSTGRPSYWRFKSADGLRKVERVVQPGPVEEAFLPLAGPEFAAFRAKVDAVLPVPGTRDEMYMFSGDSYLRMKVAIDGTKDQVVNGPKPIRENFGELARKAPAFTENIDAAFSLPRDPGTAYLFKGNAYVKLALDPGGTDDRVLEGPERICAGWQGLCGTVFDGEVPTSTAAAEFSVLASDGGNAPAAADAGSPVDTAPDDRGTKPASGGDCRPDGLTPVDGTSPRYCDVYDGSGREWVGQGRSRRTVGYFTGWRTGADGSAPYLVNNIPWSRVSHVNYAFAHVENDRISVGDTADPRNPATGMTWPGVAGAETDPSLPYQGHFNLLTRYKRQHPAVKTLISVGGWAESSGFYALTTRADGTVNQPAIDTFAASVAEFLDQYGFDGADIDYEYPTALPQAGNPHDWPVADARRKGLGAGYEALMKALRGALDRAGAAKGRYYLLTSAVSGSGYLVRGQEAQSALKYQDFVNVMTYDLHGSWNDFVGPQAPLYDDGRDAELAAAGIYDDQDPNTKDFQKHGYFNTDWAYHYYRGALPPSRINLGIPYYTRGWQDVTGGTDGLWGHATMADQQACPPGTGGKGNGGQGTGASAPCGEGAIGIDNLWHDTDNGREVPAGSNPLWHVKNLQDGRTPGYLSGYGLDTTRASVQLRGTYQEKYGDALESSWLWNPDKKVFLSTENDRSIRAKARYIGDQGIGGAMIWELAGDYAKRPSGEWGMGYDLTTTLDTALRQAGPAKAERADAALPQQVLDVTAELVDYPTDVKDMWPIQPKLRITNNTAATLPAGTRISFDIPTSTTPLLKDEAWKELTDAVQPGRTGPNTGGLKADFHRVTLTLGTCEELPPGKARDIGIKYYLPITGPANFTIGLNGTEYGLAQDHRRGTTAAAAPQGDGARCQADAWDPGRTYNPAWAPFTLWQTGDTYKVEDVNSGNLLDHPGGWDTAHLVEKQDGNANQLWTVAAEWPDFPGWYRIKSTTGGHEQCLDARAPQAALGVRDCDMSPGQWWHLRDDKGDLVTSITHGASYGLESFAPGSDYGKPDYVAEPRNSGTAPGTPIVAGDPGGSTRTIVSYGGYYWRAKYWTKGDTPNASDPKNPWTRLGPTA